MLNFNLSANVVAEKKFAQQQKNIDYILDRIELLEKELSVANKTIEQLKLKLNSKKIKTQDVEITNEKEVTEIR